MFVVYCRRPPITPW